ncbi:MAG: hypothetical protein Q8M88_04830 [Phenylobacterium sp.]|uniref:hypothetical protein n=1 Tax=Phenylobacterium sp. TaxID=1871053 RepID=UPI0027327B3E|nr:hypothetical protein [Phenylobacterium sp.]MDP3173738.1 hypothetical protein [Phenylobacterium sp.]
MNRFRELVGASGAVYRFRLCEDLSELPAQAGNFVWISSEFSPDEVVCCGIARSLLEVRAASAAVLLRRPSSRLYLRLNVGRAVREAEHQDIVAAVQPLLILAEAA